MINISIEFKLQDVWVGMYWRVSRMIPGPIPIGTPFSPLTKYQRRMEVWICIIPCFPIKVEWTGCERGLYDHKPLGKSDSAQDAANG